MNRRAARTRSAAWQLGLLGLLGLYGCPGLAPTAAVGPAPTAAVDPRPAIGPRAGRPAPGSTAESRGSSPLAGDRRAGAQTAAELLTREVQRLDQELTALAVADRYKAAYARLRQRSQDGERGAMLVLLVFTVRDALREDCADAGDRRAFAQQLELLDLHLSQPQSSAAEWAFAGPTLLLGLHQSGRGVSLPGAAERVVAQARAALPAPGAGTRLGEVLADCAHALRLACHLKEALPLQEEAVRLLDPHGPTLAAQLSRRDLATLRFLLGDAPGAQQALDELQRQLSREEQRPVAAAAVEKAHTSGGEEASLAARREIVTVLRTHLVDAGGTLSGPAPPRETGPGWQALRVVQEQASCPQASPANPRLLRVPVRPPTCVPPATP